MQHSAGTDASANVLIRHVTDVASFASVASFQVCLRGRLLGFSLVIMGYCHSPLGHRSYGNLSSNLGSLRLSVPLSPLQHTYERCWAVLVWLFCPQTHATAGLAIPVTSFASGTVSWGRQHRAPDRCQSCSEDGYLLKWSTSGLARIVK